MTVSSDTNNTVSFKQHQRAMKILEERLAKAKTKLSKVMAKVEKDRQKAQDKLNSIQQKIQTKLNKQRERDKATIDKRIAKFEFRQEHKKTKQREGKEATKWSREILKEEKRQHKIQDQQRWKGSKKFRSARNKVNTQLTNILSRKNKIYNPATKRWVKKDGKIGRQLQKALEPKLVYDGIEDDAQKWSISGEGHVDPRVFLDITRLGVENTINTIPKTKKVNTVLICEMAKTDPDTEDTHYAIVNFRSYTHTITTPEDTTIEYEDMVDKMLESLANHQNMGSGWRVSTIEELVIYIARYKPLNGYGYTKLPTKIKNKNAIINMKNKNDECFKWAVTRAINPVTRDPERITKILKIQAENLNWNNLEFPVKLTNIVKFEKNNDIGVNVFSCEDKDKQYSVYPLRLTKIRTKTVNLFLWDNHYSVVKDLSRLVSSQISKRKARKHICNSCMNEFGTEELLGNHRELCENHRYQKQKYPDVTKDGDIPTTHFKNVERINTVPFVCYADFECYIEDLETDTTILTGDDATKMYKKASTTRYQKHNPSGFCYYIKCFDDELYPPKLVNYTQQSEGEDIAKKFIEFLEKDTRDIYNRFLRYEVPINLTPENKTNHRSATKCYACDNEFALTDWKVRDHCHLTGKYRGQHTISVI